MAAKKQTNDLVKEIKGSIQSGKAILGTERVLKGLRSGTLKKVFVAQNCPVPALRDVTYYAKLADVSVSVVEMSNEEFGVLCKKNFFVSVLGILKE